MKKFNVSLLFVSIMLISSYMEGADNKADEKAPVKSNTSKPINKAEQAEEYELLNRDQIDNSNTLAIPFDDSEVEDEEEIDRLENKDVFALPHSR